MGQHASRFGRVRLAAPKRRLQPDQAAYRDVIQISDDQEVEPGVIQINDDEPAPPQGAGGEHQYQQRRVRARRQQEDQARRRRQQQQQRSRPCPVCLNEMDEPAANTTLPCAGRHQIHSECWQGMRAFDRERTGNQMVSTRCPMCRQQIAAPREPIDTSVLRMWPARRADWAIGQAMMAHVRADDDPAVARAIWALRGMSPATMLAHARAEVPAQLAYEIVSRIFFFNDRMPETPARAEVQQWITESPVQVGTHLALGTDFVAFNRLHPRRALTPPADALARSVLAPLTRQVVRRVAEIVRQALS